jgi:hypothetical protein
VILQEVTSAVFHQICKDEAGLAHLDVLLLQSKPGLGRVECKCVVVEDHSTLCCIRACIYGQ